MCFIESYSPIYYDIYILNRLIAIISAYICEYNVFFWYGFILFFFFPMKASDFFQPLLCLQQT